MYVSMHVSMYVCIVCIEDGARLDISMSGFWGGKCEKTFLDVKVFNPYAASNRSSTPRAIYRSHENMKKRSYQAQIIIIILIINNMH